MKTKISHITNLTPKQVEQIVAAYWASKKSLNTSDIKVSLNASMVYEDVYESTARPQCTGATITTETEEVLD